MPTVYYYIGSIDVEKAVEHSATAQSQKAQQSAIIQQPKLAVGVVHRVLVGLDHLLKNGTHTNFEF